MTMMDALADLRRRVAALERRSANGVRVGVVSSVDRARCRVRVTFDDRAVFDADGTKHAYVSGELPVLVKQSVENRDFWLPAVDEQVVCVFLSSNPEIGFVLGSFYSDADAPPDGVGEDGARVVQFSDDARFEYSTAQSRLRILVGDLEVEITPATIKIGGPGATQPFVLGTAMKDWLAAHVHPTGVGPSGPPSTAGTLPTTLSTIITGR